MNNNYENILKAGFNILTKNSKRKSDWVAFTSGHRTASNLIEAVSSKRVNTHLDRALARLSTHETVAPAIEADHERATLHDAIANPNQTSTAVKL